MTVISMYAERRRHDLLRRAVRAERRAVRAERVKGICLLLAAVLDLLLLLIKKTFPVKGICLLLAAVLGYCVAHVFAAQDESMEQMRIAAEQRTTLQMYGWDR